MLPSQIPIDEMFDLDDALTMAVDSTDSLNQEEVDDSKAAAAAAAAASRLLDEVPTVEASAGGECAVCSEGLRLGGGGAAKRIPCGHVFHRDCIFRWLAVVYSCPLCRQKFPAPANISSE